MYKHLRSNGATYSLSYSLVLPKSMNPHLDFSHLAGGKKGTGRFYFGEGFSKEVDQLNLLEGKFGKEHYIFKFSENLTRVRLAALKILTFGLGEEGWNVFSHKDFMINDNFVNF